MKTGLKRLLYTLGLLVIVMWIIYLAFYRETTWTWMQLVAITISLGSVVVSMVTYLDAKRYREMREIQYIYGRDGSMFIEYTIDDYVNHDDMVGRL